MTADTNVLVRAITDDDKKQSGIARAALEDAEIVAVPLPVLCELVWVLSRGYKVHASDIELAIRRLINVAKIVVNRPAVDAGLALLNAGGDFADGVIAYEGRRLGGDMFVSFDARAVALISAQKELATLLA